MNITGNVLTEIKKLKEFSQNIVFCDPPYNLGSVWQIGKDGKPDTKGKAVDFMNNKWEGLTGEDLESMFVDFFRILKHGGYCVFAGQMRQAMAFQYYAIASGFTMIEPIYSYSISNFPKALDVSKSLDKLNGRFYNEDFKKYCNSKRKEKRYSLAKINEFMDTAITGGGFASCTMGEKTNNELPTLENYKKLKCILDLDDRFDKLIKITESEREIIGKDKSGKNALMGGISGTENCGDFNITAPPLNLAKKYNGIKSSICPLKQTTEVWFIFRKPFKHGTITKDIIAYEEGDQTIAVSGLNIDGGRVATSEENRRTIGGFNSKGECYHNDEKYKINTMETSEAQGRYPAQLFLDGSISYKREDIDLDNKDFLEFVGIDSDVISFMETEKAIDYVCAHLDKFNVADLLDEQSGVLRTGGCKDKDKEYTVKESNSTINFGNYSGKICNIKKESFFGCSRILHHSGFTLTELYQHIFYQKPSRFERNSLISEEVIEPKKYFHDGRTSPIEYPSTRDSLVSVNPHPCLKSLKLLWNIIQLFKTVDIEKMKILIPFSGVRSEKIAWLSHGAIEENITAIEISEEYDKIGEARERFWIENDFFFTKDKDVQTKIKAQIEKDKKIVDDGNFFKKKKIS